MNTPVFLEVWRHVINTGIFRRWRWTVKTEVDVVFLTPRLQRYLASLPSRGREAVLGGNDPSRNWPQSEPFCTTVFGAMEILSYSAISAYPGRDGDYPCEWAIDIHNQGEDEWLQNCYPFVLGARIEPMPRLLNDMHRRRPAELLRMACGTNFVADHPFKDQREWEDCFQRMKASSDADFRATVLAPLLQTPLWGTCPPP